MSYKTDTDKAHTKSPLHTNCFSTANRARQINRVMMCKMQQLVAPVIARSKCRTSIYNHRTDPQPVSYAPIDVRHHKKETQEGKKKSG